MNAIAWIDALTPIVIAIIIAITVACLFKHGLIKNVEITIKSLKEWTIRAEKAEAELKLLMNNFDVVSLDMCDSHGNRIDSVHSRYQRYELDKGSGDIKKNHYRDGKEIHYAYHYILENGPNIFKCIATYKDGSQKEFNAYWRCGIKGVYQTESNTWVLGRGRKTQVTLNGEPNHERYVELSCWTFEPRPGENRENNPHVSIGLAYEN